MPICFISGCQWQFSSFKVLLSHYKYRHRLKPVGCEMICNERNCGRVYGSLRGLKDHFKKCHSDLVSSSDFVAFNVPQLSSLHEDEDILESMTSLLSTVEERVSDNLRDPSLTELLSPEEFRDYIKFEAATMLQTLYSQNTIPRNKVQLVVELVTNLFASFADYLQVNFSTVFKGSEACIANLVEPLLTPFSGLETEYQRFKYFESLGTFIPPKSFLIGESTEAKTVKGVSKITIFRHEGQYLSLIKTLSYFLSSNDAISKILRYMKELQNETCGIQNFVQGQHWRSRKYDKIVIPLSVYSDEYETGNALGSHHGIHKLSGVYVSILSMPPEFQSKEANIFLTMLFHSEDRKTFGNQRVFQILIDELKILYSQGISFKTPSFSGTVYFTAELHLGDNLDLNSRLGFVESFTSNHPCRFCKIHLSSLRLQTEDTPVVLRDRLNYEADVATNNPTTTGIKETCVWHQLPYFHTTENVGVDPLHSLLEGVCKYDFVVILKDLVYYKKCFTLEILNSNMRNYNYGTVPHNIPPPITDEALRADVIRMSGSEMQTFCQFFGLFIGHYVSEGDRSFQLFTSLRYILDIAFSSFVQNGVDELLKVYVWEHNRLYLSFPDTTLKFKFHVLTHYPSQLKMFGPLRSSDNRKNERKHQPSIQTAKSVSSRRNISRTLAIKDRLKFHHFLQSKREEVLKKKLEFGPDSRLAVRIDQYEQIKVAMPQLYQSFSWIKVNGTLYKPGMCVITDFADHLPQLACIKEIITLPNKSVVFICESLRTIYFNEHYFAYKVEISEEITLIHLDSLAVPLPVSLTKDFKSELFVTFIGC